MKVEVADDLKIISDNKFLNALHRFELLSIATKEGIWEYDFITRKSYYNSTMTDIFGYSEEEMEDNNTWWRSNLHPEDRAETIHILDELLAGDETVWWGQYRFLCKNGEYKKVLDRLFVVRDKEKKALRLIGTMQDLSELDALQLQVEHLKLQHHREMIKASIETEEKERRDISEELHENINQVLATVNMRIANASPAINDDEHEGLNEIKELLSYSIMSIRSIAKRLSPIGLEELGLKTVLEELLSEIKPENNISWSVAVDERCVKNLSPGIQTLLYRIVQLHLDNIEKHSDGKNVFIKVRPMRGKTSMAIYDDGTGTDLENLEYGRGFSIIQERIEAFGGSFNLKSSVEEKGFILTVTI